MIDIGIWRELRALKRARHRQLKRRKPIIKNLYPYFSPIRNFGAMK